jgi:uncharacterized protein YlaN (UPF0358 family)
MKLTSKEITAQAETVIETSIAGIEREIDFHRVKMQLYPFEFTWTQDALELARKVIKLERILSDMKRLKAC